MSLSTLSETALTYIVTYGALAVGVLLMLAALGLPLPSTLLVLASGAFVQQGVLEPYSTLVVALALVVLGDSLSYGMGRLLRRPIVARFGQAAAWQRAEAYFARRGALAVFLTRCLLTPIAVPLNLVAGSSGYPVRKFVTFAAAGELTWLLVYGGLGYTFGSQWEALSDFISNFSGVLVGLLIAGAGAYALLRRPGRPETRGLSHEHASTDDTDDTDDTDYVLNSTRNTQHSPCLLVIARPPRSAPGRA